MSAIVWEPQYRDSVKGVSPTRLYLIWLEEKDSPIWFADIMSLSTCDWSEINTEFSTLEEAIQWCEACEATGAY